MEKDLIKKYSKNAETDCTCKEDQKQRPFCPVHDNEQLNTYELKDSVREAYRSNINCVKKTEIRVGNIVKVFFGVNDDGPVFGYWKVKGIGDAILLSDGISNITKSFNDVIGVPLTHDIFIKMGFDFRNPYYFYRRKMIDNFILHYDGFAVWVVNDKVFQSVHEIQNLFFALTGEEIDFKI